MEIPAQDLKASQEMLAQVMETIQKMLLVSLVIIIAASTSADTPWKLYVIAAIGIACGMCIFTEGVTKLEIAFQKRQPPSTPPETE
jgi:uncharacterized membrane protein YgdD (TMEM256/DUF423 family)